MSSKDSTRDEGNGRGMTPAIVAAMVLAMIAVLGTADVLAEDCRHERVVEETLDLEDAELLQIRARAGELEIAGGTRREAVIEARLCASSEELLEQIEVVIEGGERALVEVLMPDTGSTSWMNWGSNRYAYADLDIVVPAELALDVKDSSGPAVIEDVGPLEMQDSSGELIIRKVRGDLSVSDSSGDLIVEQVEGNVTLTDSSGDMDVRNVSGDVLVRSDSSGDVSLESIQGQAVVREDSSGDIRFRDVGPLALVERDSSGSIRADGVAGDFRVERDSSGRISHSGVQGTVDIPDHKR